MKIYEDFLLCVRGATHRKRLSWTQSGPGEFTATGGIRILVRQIVPLIAGPTETIGPQAFEVLAANVNFTVWDGSEACEIIREILAEAFPGWASQRELVVERLNAAMEQLR